MCRWVSGGRGGQVVAKLLSEGSPGTQSSHSHRSRIGRGTTIEPRRELVAGGIHAPEWQEMPLTTCAQSISGYNNNGNEEPWNVGNEQREWREEVQPPWDSHLQEPKLQPTSGTSLQGPAARFQRPALWIIVSLIVLQVLAFVGSGVWIFRLHQEIRDLKMKLNLKQIHESGADHVPSCPLYWQLRGRKCYYFPVVTDRKRWIESHEDCSSRCSILAVIEDKAELDYLSSELTKQIWIGLYLTPTGRRWAWVNGSTLNETVFHVTGSSDGNQCGAVNRGSIESSPCISDFYWVCQKEAGTSSSMV